MNSPSIKFEIDQVFLKGVYISREWGMYDHIPEAELTADQLVNIIKGKDRCSTSSSEDHPEFTQLREQLGHDGYIRIERGWWNGDSVIKPFILNNYQFNQGDQFPCSIALQSRLKV